MNLPKPYFKDIKGVGSLDIEYIIFEAGYPVMFTCTDKFNDLYLCLCCDIRNEQRWIISRTNPDIVKDMLSDKISLYDSLKSPYSKNHIVKWSYKAQKEESYEVDFSDIDELDLPVRDEYIEAEDDEFKEYIDRLITRKNNYEVTEVKINTIKARVMKCKKISIEIQYTQDDKYRDIWRTFDQNTSVYSINSSLSRRNKHMLTYNTPALNLDFVPIGPSTTVCHQYSF